METRIRVIPAKKRAQDGFLAKSKNKRRKVAAYARVSTDMDEQLNSYEAQISYYTKHIKSNPEWDFVKVYTDEGISGLMTKKREGFQEMIADALAGKIDLILTKSVSRFARNTVDTLTHVRQLKDKGVEVFFEKENIYTMDSKGELLITIMSSLAQEESRSLSENVTWGQRKRFSDGKVTMPYRSFLGYKKGKDGRPEVVPEEAKIVRRIYREFLLGMTFNGIARGLETDGIKSPRGKDKWSITTIKSILQNEKYKGDALLQKRFTVDFLTKKQKVNEGEVPQYYVDNSHEGIVSDEVFEMAQHEMERREKMKVNGSSKNFFSGRIICGCCGEPYTRKVWHSTTKYRRYIWQCGKKYEGEEPCSTPHFTEDEIIAAFEEVVRELVASKEDIITLCRDALIKVLDTNNDKEKAKKLEIELDQDYLELGQQLRAIGKTELGENEDYENALAAYEAKNQSLIDLKEWIADKDKRRFDVLQFADRLEDITDIKFSEELWCSLIDHVSVPKADENFLYFHLRNGAIIDIVFD